MAERDTELRPHETPPDPVDVYVGARIRLRRTFLHISQQQFGHMLGVTYQQVQKYEHGTNRVGASRLLEISRILKMPIAYFFDGMPDDPARTSIFGARGHAPQFAEQNDQLARRETRELIHAYYHIPNPLTRKRMFDLVKALAASETS